MTILELDYLLQRRDRRFKNVTRVIQIVSGILLVLALGLALR